MPLKKERYTFSGLETTHLQSPVPTFPLADEVLNLSKATLLVKEMDGL